MDVETQIEVELSLMERELLRCEDTALFRAVEHLSRAVTYLSEQPLITAPATPTAPTPDARSDVDAWMQETAQRLLAASIALLIPPSSPLDPHATGIGPAGPCCGCATPDMAVAYLRMNTQDNIRVEWCLNCRALTSDARTLVPAAAPT